MHSIKKLIFNISSTIIWIGGTLLSISCFGQEPRLIVPLGHLGGGPSIKSITYSPNGKMILSCSEDRTAILWDLSGKVISSFIGHSSRIINVEFSPDSKMIFTNSEDGDLKMWDLSGREIKNENFQSQRVSALGISPDGTMILLGCEDGSVKFWSFNNSKFHDLYFHETAVTSIFYCSNGNTIISGSSDGTLKLWDFNKNILREFPKRKSAIISVAISPDGKTIFSSSWDNMINFYDLEGQLLDSIPLFVRSVKFSPNSDLILTSGYKNIKLINLQSKKFETIKVVGEVFSVCFSPNGNTFLTGSDDGVLRLWDLKGHLLQSFGGHTSTVNSVAYSKDSRIIVTGNTNMTQLWNLENNYYRSFSNGGSTVTFSPDSKKILTGNWGSRIKLWDIEGKEIKSFMGHSEHVSAVNFSVNGQFILSGSRDSAVILWNMEGEPLKVFKDQNSNAITSVSFSPNGKTILIGSEDKSAKLLDVNGSILHGFNHNGLVTSVAFSQSGDTLLTGSEDGMAKLWDSSGNLLDSFNHALPRTRWTYQNPVTSVSFSPCGKKILTGSGDGNARLWDLEKRISITFSGHKERVTSVAFSPDGKYILTGSDDHTAKIWNTENTKEIATLVGIDSNDWVITSPGGLFDASPGAMSLMHYVVFFEGDFEVIELDQLKDRYYEPGLLQKLLGFSDEVIRPVENFEIVPLYPEVNTEILNDTLYIKLFERNGGIGKVSIFINGKEVKEEANPIANIGEFKRANVITLNLKNETLTRYYYNHPDSSNIISIRAYNEAGWLKSKTIELPPYKAKITTSRGDEVGGRNKPGWTGVWNPKLYVITIGTSNYAGTKLDLAYADQDATMMAQALYAVGAALYTRDSLEVFCLSTALPGRSGLEGSAIDWKFADKINIENTFKSIKERAKAEDVVVVYFSGHGITYGSNQKVHFHYLTSSLSSEDLSDDAIRSAYTISSEELTGWLTDIPALKQVLIIDACNSGQVIDNLMAGGKNLNSSQIRAIDRMKDRTGMFIISGSGADKISYESPDYGQGLLTYSLLEGIRGAAVRKGESKELVEFVDIMKLFQYSRDRVPALASSISRKQTPILCFPQSGASIDIGILNEITKASIPIGVKKPVVIRSNFLNELTFDDDLQIVALLENKFYEESQKGPNADFIYVDVNKYPGAYALRGVYKNIGDNIEIRVKLFVDKVSQDLIIPSENNAKKLSDLIIRKMKEAIRLEESKKDE